MRRTCQGTSPRAHRVTRNEASERTGRARPSSEHSQLGQTLVADVLNPTGDRTARSDEPLITGSFYLKLTRLKRGTRRTAYSDRQVDRPQPRRQLSPATSYGSRSLDRSPSMLPDQQVSATRKRALSPTSPLTTPLGPIEPHHPKLPDQQVLALSLIHI